MPSTPPEPSASRCRIDIEGLALRRSIELGDQAWLDSVNVAHDRLRAVPYRYPDEPGVHYEEWVVRHGIFHRALVNACGSQWLLGFRNVLHEQSERYRRLSIRDVSMVRDVEAEHAAIVEAVVRRDADAAVDALARHFDTTRRFVERNSPEIAEVGSFRK